MSSFAYNFCIIFDQRSEFSDQRLLKDSTSGSSNGTAWLGSSPSYEPINSNGGGGRDGSNEGGGGWSGSNEGGGGFSSDRGWSGSKRVADWSSSNTGAGVWSSSNGGNLNNSPATHTSYSQVQTVAHTKTTFSSEGLKRSRPMEGGL